MTGVCTDCGREWRMPSHRGSRLAGHSCPECGGRLQGKTKGERVECAVRGPRRRSGGGRISFPDHAFDLDPESYEAKRIEQYRRDGSCDAWGQPALLPL